MKVMYLLVVICDYVKLCSIIRLCHIRYVHVKDESVVVMYLLVVICDC